MSSILTNNSAMVALQTLKGINKGLGETQSQISTGKKISSAKDSAAVWAISKVMETDKSAFDKIGDQLGAAEATVGVALAGAEAIEGILQDMKNLAIDGATDTADHTKIQNEIAKKAEQLNGIISASQFNGINLLKDDIGNGETQFTVLASLDRTNGTVATAATKITVDTLDFTTNIDTTGLTAVTDKASAETAIGEIEAMLDTATNGAAALGASAKRIGDQSEFVSKLSDALKSGIGSLVDADMEEASARLQALQVQQQLATQSLSIANQAPQQLLSLFR